MRSPSWIYPVGLASPAGMTDTDQQFSLFDLDLDPDVEDRKSATTPSGRFSKFYCDGGRENVGTGYENWGLKVFPPQISEKPR